MGEVASACAPWGCTRCGAVVFIPLDAGIEGGVCTQQTKGCDGELTSLGEAAAKILRLRLAASRIVEQPWLTLIFEASPEALHIRPASDGAACEVHDWTLDEFLERLVPMLRERHGKGRLSACRECLERAKAAAERARGGR